MISKERVHSSEELEEIITNLKTLEGYYNPEQYKMMIKKLLPEYQSLTENVVQENFMNNNKIVEYNFQR